MSFRSAPLWSKVCALIGSLLVALAVCVGIPLSTAVAMDRLPAPAPADFDPRSMALVVTDISYVLPGYDQAGGWHEFRIDVRKACSGFAVNDRGRYLTAGHCTDGYDRETIGYVSDKARQRAEKAGYTIPATIAQQPPLKTSTVRIVQNLATGAPCVDDSQPAELVVDSSITNGDISVLQAQSLICPTIPVVAAGNLPVEGSPATCVGYTEAALQAAGVLDQKTGTPDIARFKASSLQPTAISGSIIESDETIHGADGSFLSTGCELQAGMSGGPTTVHGRVVGVSSSTYDDESQGSVAASLIGNRSKLVVENTLLVPDLGSNPAFFSPEYLMVHKDFRHVLNLAVAGVVVLSGFCMALWRFMRPAHQQESNIQHH